MIIALVASMAFASDKPALEKPVMPVFVDADYTEVEPNDTCADAGAFTAGDTFNGAIDPAGEMDYFEFSIPEAGTVIFETHAGAEPALGDSKLYVFADDCETQLGYNDDGGEGYYSLIELDLEAGQIVYVQVIGYSASYAGGYILSAVLADPPPPAPENDLCEGALPLPMGETFMVNLCGANGDYSPPSGGCTGYSANGLDIVYVVELVEGQVLDVTGVTDYDNAIYLVTDCADVENTCVAGADATTNGTEQIIFDALDAPGIYYLIIDGYSSTACGDWEITVGGVVPAESSTFGSVKSMYR